MNRTKFLTLKLQYTTKRKKRKITRELRKILLFILYNRKNF
ncbi:hypothetical protein HMPREF9124_2280 [Oribacterium sp. oral taxon 108 str. F0425]|nr:hypothetical protein HMPREF9124_2280 [Oribacterium sp. oral taxon 108 str. F0425]